MPTFDQIQDFIGGPHLMVEISLIVLATVPVILFGDKVHLREIRSLDRRFHRFAARKTRAVVLVFLLAIGARVALLPVVGVPEPHIHDEFSHLLAADTFAAGRLTNPTPAFWEHFETFHVIMRPTYMSMYQPGQGLVLAAGIKLGSAWIGILVTTALMCAGLTWALQAFLPPGWAWLGGLIAVARIGLLSYWINAYWGGSLAALGGILLIGAYGRLVKGPKLWHGIVAGVGAVILAGTRPFEGMIVCAVTGVAALVEAIRRKQLQRFVARIAVPVVLCVGIYAAWLGYYNFRVTGSPTRLPYLVDLEQYSLAPRFLWEHPRTPPSYRNAAMKNFYTGWEYYTYRERKGWFGVYDKLRNQYRFYYAHLFLIPLLMGLTLVRHRRTRTLLTIGAVSLVAMLTEVWLQAHYTAMLLPVFYLLVLLGMRRMRMWPNRHHPKGLVLMWMIFIVGFFMLGVRLAENGDAGAVFPPFWDTWVNGLDRQSVIDQLNDIPGRHLVFLHYGPTHNPHAEWVYNRGDIEHARIIWSREMDPISDAALIDHYSGRRVWVLDPAKTPLTPRPYPLQELHAAVAEMKDPKRTPGNANPVAGLH